MEMTNSRWSVDRVKIVIVRMTKTCARCIASRRLPDYQLSMFTGYQLMVDNYNHCGQGELASVGRVHWVAECNLSRRHLVKNKPNLNPHNDETGS